MLIRSYEQRITRHEVKIARVLHFLRDETWSSGEILAALLGLSKTGIYKTLNQMERKGFIRAQQISEIKRNIYGITPQGLLYAWSENEVMQERPYFEPSRVKLSTIQHYLDTQLARLCAREDGWVHWVPGHLLPKGIAKRPDAMVKTTQGITIAVEIERTVKSRKRYEAIFSIYLQAIKRGEYDYIHYVCPDEVFATRLQRLFGLIDAIPIAGKRIDINDKHRARFPVYSLGKWPPK
jgi:biotin operon repressor